jgi:hypothetical protein
MGRKIEVTTNPRRNISSPFYKGKSILPVHETAAIKAKLKDLRSKVDSSFEIWLPDGVLHAVLCQMDSKFFTDTKLYFRVLCVLILTPSLSQPHGLSLFQIFRLKFTYAGLLHISIIMQISDVYLWAKNEGLNTEITLFCYSLEMSSTSRPQL